MNWLKKACKFFFYFVIGYSLHLLVEAFIVANVFAVFGWSIPVII